MANSVSPLGDKLLLKFGILAWSTFYYFAKQCQNVGILLYLSLDPARTISFPGRISEGMQVSEDFEVENKSHQFFIYYGKIYVLKLNLSRPKSWSTSSVFQPK